MIKRLKLHNVFSHRDEDFTFVNGINAIVGENGTGKTSVLSALAFLWTGYLPCKKEEAITLGEATGYAYGEFEINGEIAKIERHLDCNKVILEYKGKTYKKATEVKELWDSLLGVNPDIINNVIFARQGKIADIFSGDQSVREKLFQKIFFVPNCTGLRTVIWDYISKCPSLYPEEDIAKILTDKLEAEKVISDKTKELKSLNVNNEDLEKCRTKIAELSRVLADSFETARLEGIKLAYLSDISNCDSLLTSPLLTLSEETSLSIEIRDLSTCIQDYPKFEALKKELQVAEDKRDNLSIERLTILHDLASFGNEDSIALLKARFDELLVLQDKHKQKVALEDKLVGLTAMEALQIRYTKAQEALEFGNSNITSLSSSLATTNARISELIAKSNEHTASASMCSSECPTCHRAFDNAAEIVNLQAEYVEKNQIIAIEVSTLNQEASLLNSKIAELKAAVVQVNTLLSTLTNLINERSLIEQQLEPLKNVMFEEFELQDKQATLTKYAELTKTLASTQLDESSADKRVNNITLGLSQLKQLDISLAELTDKLTNLNELKKKNDSLKTVAADRLAMLQEIAKVDRVLTVLTKYTGEGDPKEELIKYQQLLLVLQNSYDQKIRIVEQIKLLEQQFSLFEPRISQSKAYAEKNVKIKKYKEALEEAYELFHPHNFPRRLISSYTKTVEALLAENIVKFDFPYTVSIDESFSAVVKDEDGNVLPFVSGGQQMIIGLCFRFALHTMFGSNFKQLILDEGTQNMDVVNQQRYFNALQQFKETANIGQIIVIDHNEGLSRISDKTTILTRK